MMQKDISKILFSAETIQQRIDELSQLDVDIKTGKIDRFKGLELFLVKIGGER